MLKIRENQLSTLELHALEASRFQIIDYLYQVVPGFVSELNFEELGDFVVMAEKSGNDFGLVSQGAHMKWAYLLAVTDATLIDNEETVSFFQTFDGHPDRAIDSLLQALDKVWKED